MAVSGGRANRLARLMRRFARNARGGTVIIFSLLLPVIVLAIGGTIDYATLSIQRDKLQVASDAAAVAAARELHLANVDPNRLNPIVQSVVNANLGSKSQGVSVSTTATTTPLSVTVELTQSYSGFFTQQFGNSELGARSVARVSGGTALCVLALDDNARASVSLEMNSRLTGNECAVYSNSGSSSGIASRSGARLEAPLICSHGGVEGGASNFEPEALTDCPPMEDPLANRPAPPIGSCTENNFNVGGAKANKGQQVSGLNHETKHESKGKEEKTKKKDETPPPEPGQHVTLKPGTYCGGLAVGGAARVTLSPGIYVIKDGPLFVSDFGTLEGKNVGFYFTGSKSTLFFNANTTISLSAPESGPMAGLLFFQERSAKLNERFSILSDDARVLEGTLYLPRAHLYIDADAPIADRSAYTVIIANSMSLFAGPHVVLNSDYDDTNVPVPGGIAHDRVITLTE